MKQTALKIKNYASNINVVNNNDLNKKIFNFISVSFGISFVFYILLVGTTFFNIAERKVLEKEAHVLASQVGDLELSYLSLYNKMDVSLSYTMGYQEVKPSFATRVPLGAIKFAKNEI